MNIRELSYTNIREFWRHEGCIIHEFGMGWLFDCDSYLCTELHLPLVFILTYF